MHEVNDNQSEFGSLQNILIQANRNDSISAISVPDIRQLTNDTDSIFDSQSQNSNWFCDFEKFLNDAESLKLFSVSFNSLIELTKSFTDCYKAL